MINAIGSTKGTVIQRIDYYPFGTQFCDGLTEANVSVSVSKLTARFI